MLKKPTESQLPIIKTIYSLIKSGNVEEITHELIFLKPEDKKAVLASSLNSTPILHYCLNDLEVNDVDPEKLLTQKEIIDKLITSGSKHDQVDQSGNSYREKYTELLYFFIIQSIQSQDPESLETLKDYLYYFHQNDQKTLREVLNRQVEIYHHLTAKTTEYPLVTYCISHALLSTEIEKVNVPSVVKEQKLKAQELKVYGADPKQVDYKGRGYDGYVELRYPEFLLKRIKQYIVNSDSRDLYSYLENIKEDDPKILDKIFNKQYLHNHKCIPLQHYCLRTHCQDPKSLERGEALAKIILPLVNQTHPQFDNYARNYKEYLSVLEKMLNPDNEKQVLPLGSLEDVDEAKSPETPTFDDQKEFFIVTNSSSSGENSGEGSPTPKEEDSVSKKILTPINFSGRRSESVSADPTPKKSSSPNRSAARAASAPPAPPENSPKGSPKDPLQSRLQSVTEKAIGEK